jgi:hypothetical protein
MVAPMQVPVPNQPIWLAPEDEVTSPSPVHLDTFNSRVTFTWRVGTNPTKPPPSHFSPQLFFLFSTHLAHPPHYHLPMAVLPPALKIPWLHTSSFASAALILAFIVAQSWSLTNPWCFPFSWEQRQYDPLAGESPSFYEREYLR